MSVFSKDRAFFVEVVTLPTGAATFFSGRRASTVFWSRGIDFVFLPGRVAADSDGCTETSGVVTGCRDLTVFFFGISGLGFSTETGFSLLAGARLDGPLGSDGFPIGASAFTRFPFGGIAGTGASSGGKEASFLIFVLGFPTVADPFNSLLL
jgi:hypothetical protein